MKLFAVTLSFSTFLATYASAKITVPLNLRIRDGVVPGHADRARVTSFMPRDIETNRSTTTVSATYTAYIEYTMRVGIGKPPTYYNLIVELGSANTWSGAGSPYVRTSTSIPTGQNVSVIYGAGSFSGVEYLDQVTLAPELVITNQSIGGAFQSTWFSKFGFDGVIGFGPVGLTNNTLLHDSDELIPTVMNNMEKQGLIQSQVLGVCFSPLTNNTGTPSINTTENNGALTFGGTNSSLCEGNLTYTPVTKTFPASRYWGLNLTSTYGNQTIIANSTAGIVDTGTTMVLLAEDFFETYLNAIPGANFDSDTGLFDIPASSLSSMQNLTFMIGGGTFILDTAAQLFPRDQNLLWGGDPAKYYGTVTTLGVSSGQGFDFILGIKFLERFCAEFDADTNRIGFAPTNNTFSPVPSST